MRKPQVPWPRLLAGPGTQEFRLLFEAFHVHESLKQCKERHGKTVACQSEQKTSKPCMCGNNMFLIGSHQQHAFAQIRSLHPLHIRPVSQTLVASSEVLGLLDLVKQKYENGLLQNSEFEQI